MQYEEEEEDIRAPDLIIRDRLIGETNEDDINRRIADLMSDLGLSYDQAVDMVNEGIQVNSKKRYEQDTVNRLMQKAEQREEERSQKRMRYADSSNVKSKKHQELKHVLSKLKQMRYDDLYDYLITFANNATQTEMIMGQQQTDELLQVVTELVDRNRLSAADLDALMAYISAPDHSDNDDYEYIEGGFRSKKILTRRRRSNGRRSNRQNKKQRKTRCKRCGCCK